MPDFSWPCTAALDMDAIRDALENVSDRIHNVLSDDKGPSTGSHQFASRAPIR